MLKNPKFQEMASTKTYKIKKQIPFSIKIFGAIQLYSLVWKDSSTLKALKMYFSLAKQWYKTLKIEYAMFHIYDSTKDHLQFQDI